MQTKEQQNYFWDMINHQWNIEINSFQGHQLSFNSDLTRRSETIPLILSKKKSLLIVSVRLFFTWLLSFSLSFFIQDCNDLLSFISFSLLTLFHNTVLLLTENLFYIFSIFSLQVESIPPTHQCFIFLI